jgi:hypothetical protein
MMQARAYKETPLTLKLFQPETSPIPCKRELPDAATETQPMRSKPANDQPLLISSMKPKQVTIAPSTTSYPTTQPLAGKTMFRLHKEHKDKRKPPQSGQIFPHPSKAGQYAMMCTRSAYEDKTCGYSHCNHNHSRQDNMQ